MPTDVADHWREIWAGEDSDQLSWFQATPVTSIELIERHASDPASAIIDVGGGASTLAANLLERGYRDITVVDIAEEALEQARHRMGPHAKKVTWKVADVSQLDLVRPVDLWHDRALLHFLTRPEEQRAYAQRLLAILRPGGHAIIATFGPEGPTTCAGLPIQRYDAQQLADTLELELVEARDEPHRTPAGAEQPFVYAVLRRPAAGQT